MPGRLLDRLRSDDTCGDSWARRAHRRLINPFTDNTRELTALPAV